MNANIFVKNDHINFSRKTTKELFSDYQLHCHSYFELYYFVAGNIDYMVEGKTYTPMHDSLLLLKPNVVHGVRNTSEDMYCRYAFHFTANTIPVEHREILFSPFFRDRIYFENAKLESLFDNVLNSSSLSTRIREIALSCRFETLLTELYHLTANSEPNYDNTDNLAVRITGFIGEHIKEDLNLDSIAKAFFISKSHLNRIFKKNLDTTVGNYIGLKRASIARELLLQGESATTVSIACGFKDYSTFFRTYKKFIGRAPTAEVAVLNEGE